MKKKSSWTTNIFFKLPYKLEKMLVVSEGFFHVLHPEFNYWIIDLRYPLIDTQKVSRLTWYTFFLAVHGIIRPCLGITGHSNREKYGLLLTKKLQVATGQFLT